jgi:hypothetical protein
MKIEMKQTLENRSILPWPLIWRRLIVKKLGSEDGEWDF